MLDTLRVSVETGRAHPKILILTTCYDKKHQLHCIPLGRIKLTASTRRRYESVPIVLL